MDLVTQTSLDALLMKATSSNNLNFDTAAVEAFCALINKEKDGAHIGVRVISTRLPIGNEKELLQTLNVLDTCMNKCGTHFQNEVGKFRFLNEMIKLVSPKYLGSQTPLMVKQKILQLLYVWTLDYPKETKIKEAFDMLRKQGVIKQIPNPNVPSYDPNVPKRKIANSVFQDEEKSRILQKLLQSKDPEDIQAANWLIKSMVREDDKRTELKNKSITELEQIQNNVRLLSEMLDSFKPGASSSDELELINELYQNCQKLKTPATDKLVLESIDCENEEISEGMLSNVVETGKELVVAINKYKKVIVQDNSQPANSADSIQESLLNFDVVDAKPFKTVDKEHSSKGMEGANSTVDVLCDIFTPSNISGGGEVLQPVSVLKSDKITLKEGEKNYKFKALEDLDVLGELLKKENLQKSNQCSFNRNNQEKVPMNLLSKISEINQSHSSASQNSESLDLDLSCLLKSNVEADAVQPTPDTSDDFLVDISDEKMLDIDKKIEPECDKQNGEKSSQNVVDKPKLHDIKLSDIFIKLENVKPSSIPPMVILDNKNGVTVTLHLARDKPKEAVSAYVLTTVSKNELPLSCYLFQAVVPKGCKLKLQPASSTDLPPHNPFLPPSAITQILLIANPFSLPISLKFIVSYVVDEESITEMGEVDSLPAL